MTREAYSSNSIARAVYDATLEAIKVSITSGIVPAGVGANVSDQVAISNSSTEVGTEAGSRAAGILIILQDTNALNIAIGEAADASKAKLTSEGESVFLPTNESVYCYSASGSNISFIEI